MKRNKTHNFLPQFLGYLALVAGLIGVPAYGQGTTPQTLTWQGNTNAILALDTAHPLSATASSGLPVTLRVDSGPAVIANGTITVTELGTVVVSAEQAGDATYSVARVARSFNVRQVLLTRLGGYNPSVVPEAVQVVGNYAYVASYNVGLEVIDVSDPASPVRVGGYVTSGSAWDVQVVGNYAYLADGYDGFEVLDVRNPAGPVRVGGYDTSGYAHGVQVVGNYAYVADGDAGLQVIDVSDPANPVRVGGYDTSGTAFGVQVVGNYAYVADGYDGFQVLDVRNPAGPVRVGGYEADSIGVAFVRGVHVVGNYVYVAGENAGLQVIDVNDPTNPVRLGWDYTRGKAFGVQVVGNYAYVADGFAGLQVIDVSNPASLVQVGEYDTISTDIGTVGVQVVGNYAYASDLEAGLQILKIRLGYPQEFTWQGTSNELLNPNEIYPLDTSASSGLPVTLRVESGPAVIANGTITVTGFDTVVVSAEQAGDVTYLPARVTRSFNVPQAQILAWQGSSGGSAPPAEVAITNGFLALPRITSSGTVVTYSLLSGPARVKGDQLMFTGPGSVRLHAEAAGGGFYLPMIEEWTINIYLLPQTLIWQGTSIEILSPNVTYALDATTSSGLPVTLRVESGPAVLANGTITVTELGTVVVSAEQAGDATYLPARLARRFNVPEVLVTLVGGFQTSGSAFDVKVEGNIAYVAEASRLQVIDVSSPANPVRVDGYDTPGYVGTKVVGNYAYVAGASKLHVIDVSDPASPVRVGVVDTVVSAFGGMNVVGNYAYLVEWGFRPGPFGNTYHSGLEIIRVSDPRNPVSVGWLSVNNPESLQIVGNYAYVLEFEAGLQVIDVSNPARPVRVGEYSPFQSAAYPSLVRVVGNYAYLSTMEPGPFVPPFAPLVDVLLVIDVSNPTKPLRLGGISTRGSGLSDVQVQGNYAYLVGTAGLQVIDVSDPAIPVRVGGSTSVNFRSVKVAGKYAYVAAGSAGLQIFELRLGYPQTLALQLPAEVSFQDLPVASVGAASSGLPLKLSVVSGPASVMNNQVTWTQLGPVTLRAEQAGDAFFLPASAEWIVTVIPRRLGVRLAEGKVEVFWATGFAGLQLQGRELLSPDSPWQDVTTPPVEADGEARISLEEAASHRYFRLLKP